MNDLGRRGALFSGIAGGAGRPVASPDDRITRYNEVLRSRGVLP